LNNLAIGGVLGMVGNYGRDWFSHDDVWWLLSYYFGG